MPQAKSGNIFPLFLCLTCFEISLEELERLEILLLFAIFAIFLFSDLGSVLLHLASITDPIRMTSMCEKIKTTFNLILSVVLEKLTWNQSICLVKILLSMPAYIITIGAGLNFFEN